MVSYPEHERNSAHPEHSLQPGPQTRGPTAGCDVPAGVPAGTRIEQWLQDHTGLLASLVIASAFLLRLVIAATTFLNHEEALLLVAAKNLSIASALRQGIVGPHPPLYNLFLYWWHMLGNSDFLLRLPSVIAGTAALWAAHRWLNITFGRAAALVGLLLLAFAPRMLQVSTQVGPDALLLLTIFTALYLLERAWNETSPRLMAAFGFTLLLAVLIHYSATWFALGIGIYALVRIIRHRKSVAMTATWTASQVVPLLLGILLYLVHASALTDPQPFGGLGGPGVVNFHFGQDGILSFSLRQIAAVFGYFFSSGILGIVGLAAFAGGVIVALAANPKTGNTRVRRLELGLLLLLPFIISSGAAIAGVYPLSGTHHSLFLIAFAVAGISSLLVRATGRRLWLVVTAVVILMPVWNLTCTDGRIPLSDQRRQLMTAATNYIRNTVAGRELILSDFQTQTLLQRYLCGNETTRESLPDGLVELSCGRYRLVRPWGNRPFAADSFGDIVFRTMQSYRLGLGERIHVVEVGQDRHFAAVLEENLGTVFSGLRVFGSGIAVFPVPAVGHGLDSLALDVIGRTDHHIRAVFWPTRYHAGQDQTVTDRLPGELLSYEELYTTINRNGARKLYECLPALAFWVFSNTEEHFEFMRYMDDRESYLTNDLRFNLIRIGPDGVTGVYLVESPVRNALDSLALIASAQTEREFRTVLWPTRYLDDSTRTRIAGVSDLLLSYTDFYRRVRGNASRFDDYLPALAFWAFGNDDRHPELMRFMDDRESYVTGNRRFSLVLIDPDTLAGLYVIETVDNPRPHMY